MNLRRTNVSVGLAAKSAEPGISYEANELSKPVDSPQPATGGYFGGSEFVRDAQDGQMEATGATGWKAQEGGEG